MSSHMFDEVEQTCDRVALIKDGKLIDVKATDEVKYNEEKVYKIELRAMKISRFLSEPFNFSETIESQNQVIIKIHDSQINTLFSRLKSYNIKFMTERKYTLEEYFKDYMNRGRPHVE